jgi:hypothetical protein
MRKWIGALLVVASLAMAMPRQMEAQRLDRRPTGWLTLEGFLTSYQLEALADDRRALTGGGLRVLFGAAPITGIDNALVQRTSVGGYVIYTPTSANLRTWHFGGQLDFRPIAAPVGGLIEPILSLGAGALRVDTPQEAAVLGTDGELTVSETFATLVPGVGARIRLGRGIGVRTDLRDVMVFGQSTTHNWELSGGLSLLF